jgi:undecaprenyl-diphosphatase
MAGHSTGFLTRTFWKAQPPPRPSPPDLSSSLVVAFARSRASAPPLSGEAGLDLGTVAMGCVVAFLGATLGGAALRALLARRRLPALSLWLIPLGLAMCAYASALDTAGA